MLGKLRERQIDRLIDLWIDQNGIAKMLLHNIVTNYNIVRKYLRACVLRVDWRASEASETLLVVVQWKTRYVYTYIYIYVRHVYMWYVRHTFVARSWSDVMWEELSVSHF